MPAGPSLSGPAAPRATTGLLALTTVVSVGLWLVAGVTKTDWGIAAAFVPAQVAGDAAGQGGVPVWLTPLTSTLVHANLLHLGFNMLMLYWCGRQVEAAIGGGYLALLYGIGAYAAAAGQWALSPSSAIPVVGASGAISAVVAVYALVFSDQTVRSYGPFSGYVLRALWLGAAWVGLQALIGFGYGDGMIAVGEHIGGFLAGLVLARPLLRLRYTR